MTAARRLAAAPARKPRSKPRAVTPHEAEVAEAIAGIADEFIQCRDTGHTWQRHNARWLDADNLWEQTLVCRCGTRRIRYLNRIGAIIGGHYEYADGYTVKGVGRLTSEDRNGIRLRGVSG